MRSTTLCAMRGAALLAAMPLLVGATALSSNFEQRVLAAQNQERIALGLVEFGEGGLAGMKHLQQIEMLAVCQKCRHQ